MTNRHYILMEGLLEGHIDGRTLSNSLSPKTLTSWGLFFSCVCLCHTVMSVSCSLVVTCWERADLLVLMYVMFSCVLSLSHTVSWVGWGT